MVENRISGRDFSPRWISLVQNYNFDRKSKISLKTVTIKKTVHEILEENFRKQFSLFFAKHSGNTKSRKNFLIL